jgi:20S proteasome alpha/beta subunit
MTVPMHKNIIIIITSISSSLSSSWNRRQQKASYYCSFFSLLMVLFVLIVEAPHSHSKRSSSGSLSRIRNRQQYDRSITLFSDDGRLLQVEYGTEASSKGSSVACLKCSNRSVCFAVETSTADAKEGALLADKVHRVDDHCVLVTTGLAGDCRYLAHSTRLACQKHRMKNGEPPSILEIANMVAQIQHELTRTSGSRPLAVTTTIVGVDPFSSYNVRLFQCDVGGIVDECHSLCASGRKKKDATLALTKLVQQNFCNATSTKVKYLDAHIEEKIDGVARAILDVYNDSKQVDIWLVTWDPSCRGKARFRYATAVSSKELHKVKKLLSTLKR